MPHPLPIFEAPGLEIAAAVTPLILRIPTHVP
jgi:hypothetical protein